MSRGQWTIQARPYPFDVILVTDEKALNRLSREFDFPVDTDTRGQTFSIPGGPVVVSVRDSGAGTLVHELAHATVAILEQVGVPIDSDTDEAFAYLQEDLFNWAYPKVCQSRRSAKRSASE